MTTHADATTPVPVRSRPGRLPSLTGLRFFAALAVFLHHVSGSGRRTGYGPLPHTLPYTEYGTRGVMFFFVLSGFVLTWTWRPGDRALPFYGRRFARIYPLHLVTTAIAVPVFYGMSKQPFDVWPFLSSIFLVQAWIPDLVPTFPGNGVSWTLSDEAFFYAVFPLLVVGLVRLTPRRQWAVALGLLALGIVVGHAVVVGADSAKTAAFVLRTPAYRLPEFVLGVVLALALRRGLSVPGPLLLPLLAVPLWVYAYFHAYLLPHALRPWVEPVDFAVAPLLFAWLIAVVARGDLAGRRGLLGSRPLVALGTWSFAFYLVHQTIIRHQTVETGFHPASWTNLQPVLVMGLLAVAASGLLHHVVERPCERVLRRALGARRGRDVPLPAEASR